ncbi:hypothetical protein HDU76_001242 [Blyttiomyces sp. JEL0837]|nr:hypothetical protein HDU76_001242 [Blyttiomyces sp. JEL0837]
MSTQSTTDAFLEFLNSPDLGSDFLTFPEAQEFDNFGTTEPLFDAEGASDLFNSLFTPSEETEADIDDGTLDLINQVASLPATPALTVKESPLQDFLSSPAFSVLSSTPDSPAFSTEGAFFPTPPLETLPAFDVASVPAIPQQYLNLPPDQAARLLNLFETRLASAYPHLVPVVDRLRASLRAATATAAALNARVAMPPPAPVVPATPAIPSLEELLKSGLFGNISGLNMTGLPAVASGSATDLPPGVKPKAKVGRKRKERPNDPEALVRELDIKRQKNTEAARRSRLRKLAELDELQTGLATAEAERDEAQEKVARLEAELERTKTFLAIANAQLTAAGLAPISV